MACKTPTTTGAMALTRRQLIGKAAVAGVALAAPAILTSRRAHATGRVIKIGHVSPRTGPLASFGEADDFVLPAIRQALAGGIEIAGTVHPVEIVAKDTQSNPNRAAEVAAELILSDEVDLMTAASTPDTTNPVADQCEVNEVPCVTTDCPWQPYFFGRGGDPAVGFDWTYHFFWGLEDVIAAFINMWDSVDTNRVVGGLFPNDADGNAWGDAELGFPPALAANGFELVDPGRFQPFTDDFTAQVSAFKQAGVEIVTGNLVPPDFTTFWTQAAQQDFRPKIVTIGKALLFPASVKALGDRGVGLSTEVWWSPSHPFRSGLTGQTAGEFVAAYEAATGRQWTQPLGFKHALFEVATDVLRRTTDADDPAAIRDAIAATNYNSIVGPVNWSGQPVKNVTKTPLVGGQWKQGTRFEHDLAVVSNATAPQIPTNAAFATL